MPAGRRRWRRFWAAAGLVLASTAVALTVVEVCMRAFMTPMQVGPTFTTFSEDLGFENKRNLDCRRVTPEYEIRVRTNDLGLRNPPLSRRKPGGVRRVLCIGDSFTFGKGVEDDETFARHLEALLQDHAAADARVQVLNAGVVSYGTANELLYLQQRGFDLQPDLVVLQLCFNDFADNASSTLFDLDDTGELRLGAADPRLRRMVRIFDAIPFRSLLENSYLFNFVRFRLNLTIRREPPAVDAATQERVRRRAERMTGLLLQRFAQACRDAGVPLCVVSIDPNDRQTEVVRRALADLRIPTLVLQWRRERPHLYYPVDGHWNAAGHREAARVLLPLVADSLGLHDGRLPERAAR